MEFGMVLRQILALFRGQPWGDCWETGRGAYGPIWALRCHLELKLESGSVVMIDPILMLLCALNIQGREACLDDFSKQLRFTGWYQFEWPTSSSKVTVEWESKICWAHFLIHFSIDFNEIWYAVMSCWFLMLILNLFQHDLYWRERTLSEWFKRPFTLAWFGILCTVSFRLDKTMLNLTVWFTSIFIQDHTDRTTRKPEHVQAFCYKVAQSNPNFCNGWSCKEDDRKEVLWV